MNLNRKEWVKQQRAKAKEIGYDKYFLNMLKKEWEDPIHAIAVFTLNLAITFLIFYLLKQANYGMIYCDATLPNETQITGNYPTIWPIWVKNINEHNKKITNLLFEGKSYTGKRPTLYCNYNLKQWHKDTYPKNATIIIPLILAGIAYYIKKRREGEIEE